MLLLLACAAAAPACTAQPGAPGADLPSYEFRPVHDPDGIGKCYLGREIARVMGHEAADWLERPERESEEKTDLLIEQLGLRPGQVVADIGAGTGYFSRRMAERVGPSGKVLAVDVQPEMLELLNRRMTQSGVTNVTTVLGTASDPRLPTGVLDLALMVDVYHELEFPREMMALVCRSLKPGGRLVLAEFRGEDPAVPIKPLHKMTEAQVKKEMARQPLEWRETISVLPRQHLLVFQKRFAVNGESGRRGWGSSG